MKVAVINFSGNVGKTTVARHLLAPRIDGAELIAVESINADEGQGSALGASSSASCRNICRPSTTSSSTSAPATSRTSWPLMRKYCGSHEDFDYLVIPTVPALKQQQDTIATLAELVKLGIPAAKLRIVFNLVEDGADVAETFDTLLAFMERNPIGCASTQCRLGANEIYERVKGTQTPLADLAQDTTDYKASPEPEARRTSWHWRRVWPPGAWPPASSLSSTRASRRSSSGELAALTWEMS